MRVITDQAAPIPERPDELVGWACRFDIIKDLLSKTRYEHIKYRRAIGIRPDDGIKEITTLEIA